MAKIRVSLRHFLSEAGQGMDILFTEHGLRAKASLRISPRFGKTLLVANVACLFSPFLFIIGVGFFDQSSPQGLLFPIKELFAPIFYQWSYVCLHLVTIPMFSAITLSGSWMRARELAPTLFEWPRAARAFERGLPVEKHGLFACYGLLTCPWLGAQALAGHLDAWPFLAAYGGVIGLLFLGLGSLTVRMVFRRAKWSARYGKIPLEFMDQYETKAGSDAYSVSFMKACLAEHEGGLREARRQAAKIGHATPEVMGANISRRRL